MFKVRKVKIKRILKSEEQVHLLYLINLLLNLEYIFMMTIW